MSATLSPGRRSSFFHTAAIAGAALLGLCVLPAAADWPRYLGPTQNGVAAEGAWAGRIPDGTPRTIWKASVGKGTAGIVAANGRVYSMGNEAEKDTIYCFDAKTGQVIWKHAFSLALDPNMFEGGPRSTPTLDENRIYTVSHYGDLWCLDAATGKKIWNLHYKEWGGRRPEWGFAGSPTVAGNLLLCDVGGVGASTVALDKKTGKVVWKSGDHKPGYASPVVTELEGKPTVLVFKAEHLVGYDLASGKELWSIGWKTSYDVNAAAPLPMGDDRILISSGYSTGCALIQVRGGKATELWRNKNLRAQINTPVPMGNHVYGIDGNTGGGNLVCLDVNTGERNWIEKSVKGGSLIRASDKLFVLTEKGELVIADASPAGFKEHLRTQVLKARCWVQPTLSDGRLFLRDNEGNVVCLDFGAS